MNNKSLIYGFVGLVTGTAITGLLVINRTQAQSQVSEQNPLNQTQIQSQVPRQNQQRGMGMMNPQQADQHFIQMMIPHHQDAIDMANLAESKAKRPEIKKLAQDIKRDQNREIEQMKAWYKQWYGTEVPASSGMGANHMGNQGMGMMGMGMMNMMQMDIEALKNAPDFDKAFIEQMIPHHKMAVMMSSMILDSNRPEMRNLGKNITQTQSKEIEQMREYYQVWYR